MGLRGKRGTVGIEISAAEGGADHKFRLGVADARRKRESVTLRARREVESIVIIDRLRESVSKSSTARRGCGAGCVQESLSSGPFPMSTTKRLGSV